MTQIIHFTQYIRPHGGKRQVQIGVSDNVAHKASLITDAGYRFEVEELHDGNVSMTISDDDGDYAHEIVPNGPQVPDAVSRLVMDFVL